MKRIIQLFVVLLIPILFTACASQGETRVVEPTLSLANWPTPFPTEIKVTATPFPKQGLTLIATPSAESVAAKDQAAPLPTATPQPPVETTTQPESAATATASFEGMVNIEALNLRAGPGQGYAVVGVLAQNNSLALLGKDAVYGWVYGRTPDGLLGWVNPYYLTLTSTTILPIIDPQTAQSSSAISSAVTTSSSIPVANSGGGTLMIQLESGSDIMLINRDGTNLRRLTSGIDPTLSADGQHVVFTRWDGVGDDGSVWVINTDGSGEKMIFGGSKQVKGPVWSPDGSRIAINFQDGGRLETTRKCWDLRKGSPDINYWQAYDIETEVRFDNNGRPVVFLCWKVPPDAHWKLRIVNVDTGDYQDMPAGQYAFAPTWDPINPWRVVTTAGMGLAATDVNQGTASPLTTDPSDRGPVFSPDGTYIAVSYRQHDHWEIHRLNADGSGRVRLTQTPLYQVTEGEPRQWNNAGPVFSPDSSEIAFLTDRTGKWEVWVMNVDGSHQHPVFSETVNNQLTIQYHGNDERSLGWSR